MLQTSSALTALLDHEGAHSGVIQRAVSFALVVLASFTLGGCQQHDNQSTRPVQVAQVAPPRYPSEPFTAYSADDEAQVLERCRTSSREGFDSFTEHEAAYKALVVDAHFLYFAFVKLFPESEYIPEITKQLDRFHQDPGGWSS